MKKIWMLALIIFSFCALAGSLPQFLQTQACPPGNPYCKMGGGVNPPPVQIDDNAPKACNPNDRECIAGYSKQQTSNYQSGVQNPSFVDPVRGGGGCILSDASKCDPASAAWQANTVTPVTTRELPYVTGARPEFQQQEDCKSVYSPFSRTTTADCH